MGPGKRISIKLSPEQQKQVKQATGKNAEALELTVEELEQRIAPFYVVKMENPLISS